MYLLGSVITLATGFFYSIRYSLTKDLKGYNISNNQINFAYRLISLPIFFVVALILGEKIFLFSLPFLFWLSVGVISNIVWGLYNVYIYQKSPFSSMESLQFLNIVFSTFAGIFLFSESLRLLKVVGISVTVFAFVILLLKDIKSKSKNVLKVQIIVYYLIASFVDVANKKAVALSSPIIYAISVSILLSLSYLFIGFFRDRKLYKYNNQPLNKSLLVIGILAGATVLGVNYGLSILPLGVFITLLSSRVFFSMWLSKKKYNEENILPNIIASVIAFIGIVIMFV